MLTADFGERYAAAMAAGTQPHRLEAQGIGGSEAEPLWHGNPLQLGQAKLEAVRPRVINHRSTSTAQFGNCAMSLAKIFCIRRSAS